jgi:cell division septal protein FtsQ
LRKKGRLGLTIIFLICLFFVFGGSLLVVLCLGFFELEQIEVRGNNRVSQKEILKRSGLTLGKSMIFFLEEDVEREILKNPRIKSVHIKREFPKKVIIEVKEAEPFCLALGEEGELYYMSENGEKLGKTNFDEGLDFPILVGEGIIKPDLLGEALEILKLSLNSNILNWKEISEINLDSIYGITVFTNDKRRIDFGRGDIREKWHRVEKIITHSRTINLTEQYINVSSEKIGVVNFKL